MAAGMRCTAACRRWLRPPDSIWARERKQQEAAASASAIIKSPCRICHSDEETREDPLVAPCRCDGSLRYVHNACQQVWMKARRGPLEFRCELCNTRLCCRLAHAARLELGAIAAASVATWAAQCAGIIYTGRLAARVLAASWRRGPAAHIHPTGPAGAVFLRALARLLPLPAPAGSVAGGSDDADVNGAALQAVAAAVVVASFAALLGVRRPPRLVGEELLNKLCVVKIGACVLLILNESLVLTQPLQLTPTVPWSRPPLPATVSALGMTVLFDTLLLAFLRVPRGERISRGLMLRVVQAACRLTGDFVPFAAVFFLWSAAVVMIFVASLVPCAVLVFHEAFRNARRRRQGHGSLQLAFLVARVATRLLAAIATAATAAASGGGLAVLPPAANPSWIRIEALVAFFWLWFEVSLLLDLCCIRRGLCCAFDAPSQVMWMIALLGEVALIASSGGPGAGACQRTSGLGAAGRPGGPAAAGSAAQDLALVISAMCCLAAHAPAMMTWARRAKEAAVRACTHFDPGQVVFYDCPQHRAL